VGFGLSTPAHIASVGKAADAAVVGSAVMGVIERAGAAPDVADRVERFISWLVNGGPAPVENA
jgi:tryptophan synthase alpha chain